MKDSRIFVLNETRMAGSKKLFSVSKLAMCQTLFKNLRYTQIDRIASTGDRRSDRPESLPTRGAPSTADRSETLNRANDPASNAPRLDPQGGCEGRVFTDAASMRRHWEVIKKGKTMSSPIYGEFDEYLISLISKGVNTMTQLELDRLLISKAQLFCGGQPEFRVIDRRLQANRKAGKIRYDGKVWKLI